MRIPDGTGRPCNHHRASPRGKAAHAITAAAFVAIVGSVRIGIIGIVGFGGCSLAVDTRSVQCRTDQDCARFTGSACDVATRICMPVSSQGGHGGQRQPNGDGGTAGNGGSTGLGGGAGTAGPRCRLANGCVPCSAAQPDPFANSCTDATCVPFDNRTRISNHAADGGLQPLP